MGDGKITRAAADWLNTIAKNRLTKADMRPFFLAVGLHRWVRMGGWGWGLLCLSVLPSTCGGGRACVAPIDSKRNERAHDSPPPHHPCVLREWVWGALRVGRRQTGRPQKAAVERRLVAASQFLLQQGAAAAVIGSCARLLPPLLLRY
jgi:hypothetical protein